MGERVSMDTDLLNGLADAIANKFDEDVPLTVGQQTNIINAITKRSSSDLTYSGATVRAPAGYYSAQASKTIPSSDSVPTLVVGTVSNHEVTITPSVVTNTGGYISSGTITNDSGKRTISAAQLASGDFTILSSGTHNVADYATATVAAGATAPSLIRGQVSNHEITITPSVVNTAGYISSGTVTDAESAETITAADLVSGTYSITSSGTKDVTNYAAASVAAGEVTVPDTITGSSPGVAIRDGKLGLIDAVSVAPVVTTAGYIPTNGGTAKTVTVDLRSDISVNSASDVTITESSGTASVAVPAGYYGNAVNKTITSGDYGRVSWMRLPIPVGDPDPTELRVTPNFMFFEPGYFTSAPAIMASFTMQTETVTPTESTQEVEPDGTGYYLNKVTINPIPSQYIVPSGNINIISSGVHDVTNYATATAVEATVRVPYNIGGTEAEVGLNAGKLELHQTIRLKPDVTASGFISSGDGHEANSLVSLTSNIVSKNTRTYYPSTSSDQVISSNTYLRGDQTFAALSVSQFSESDVKSGVVIKIGDADDDDRICGFTGTFTSSGSVSSGQTAATTDQILFGYSAWVDGAEVQGSVSTMTLPTAVSATSSGTLKATIAASTSADKYLNIPTGHNDANAYYKISKIKLQDKSVTPNDSVQTVTPGSSYDGLSAVNVLAVPSGSYGTPSWTKFKVPVTNPTQLQISALFSDFSSGYFSSRPSATVSLTLENKTVTPAASIQTVTPTSTNYYLNTVTVNPGFLFETGTWTPTSDIAKGTISFSNTHNSMPFYVCIFDQTQTTHATGSPSYMLYTDEYQIFGAMFPSNTNFRYGCINSSFKTDSGTNVYAGTLQYPSTNTGNSSTAYPRFWVTESEFHPYSGSDSRYWRSGRTYKWVAIWKEL